MSWLVSVSSSVLPPAHSPLFSLPREVIPQNIPNRVHAGYCLTCFSWPIGGTSGKGERGGGRRRDGGKEGEREGERETEGKTEREEWTEEIRVHPPCFHCTGQPNSPTPSGLWPVSCASNLVGFLVLAQISVSGFFSL